MKTAVIIPAAGSSSRMGVTKQLMDLKGKPVLIHTIEAFEKHEEVDEIIICTSKEIAEVIAPYNFKKIKAIVPGGASRQDSVRIALDALGMDDYYVLIHDGARPLISQKVISDVLDCVRRGECATSGVISKDTIKITDSHGIVKDTPPREHAWLVQTPQGFPSRIIKKAHNLAKAEDFVGTDDAMLVERLGVSLRIIEGEYSNIKLTTPEDMQLAEILLHKRGIVK